MNGYFIVAGMLLVLSLFVHTFAGNRFYSAARPDPRTATQKACEAWLMGRCGVQLITADLTLAATFVLLLGTGVIPRNRWLEVFLLVQFGGWMVLWLVSLASEKAEKRAYLRLCQWGALPACRPTDRTGNVREGYASRRIAEASVSVIRP